VPALLADYRFIPVDHNTADPPQVARPLDVHGLGMGGGAGSVCEVKAPAVRKPLSLQYFPLPQRPTYPGFWPNVSPSNAFHCARKRCREGEHPRLEREAPEAQSVTFRRLLDELHRSDRPHLTGIKEQIQSHRQRLILFRDVRGVESYKCARSATERWRRGSAPMAKSLSV
jgi:hypothetical protein